MAVPPPLGAVEYPPGVGSLADELPPMRLGVHLGFLDYLDRMPCRAIEPPSSLAGQSPVSTGEDADAALPWQVGDVESLSRQTTRSDPGQEHQRQRPTLITSEGGAGRRREGATVGSIAPPSHQGGAALDARHSSSAASPRRTNRRASQIQRPSRSTLSRTKQNVAAGPLR